MLNVSFPIEVTGAVTVLVTAAGLALRRRSSKMTNSSCPEVCGDGRSITDVSKCEDANQCERRCANVAIRSRYPNDGDDAVQNVGLRAEQFRLADRELTPGLYRRMLEEEVIRLRRAEVRHKEKLLRRASMDQHLTSPSAEEVGAHRLWVTELISSLAQSMNREDLSVLVAYYDETVDNKALASEMGLTPRGLRARVSRIRQRARMILSARLDPEETDM